MKNLTDIIGNIDIFLEQVFLNLDKAGIDTKNYFLDHLCYRTSSQEEYVKKKTELFDYGELLVEAPVNGRLISTFKFFKPVIYKNNEIPMIEIPSPKQGKNYQSGLEQFSMLFTFNLQPATRLLRPTLLQLSFHL